MSNTFFQDGEFFQESSPPVGSLSYGPGDQLAHDDLILGSVGEVGGVLCFLTRGLTITQVCNHGGHSGAVSSQLFVPPKFCYDQKSLFQTYSKNKNLAPLQCILPWIRACYQTHLWHFFRYKWCLQLFTGPSRLTSSRFRINSYF